MATRPILMLFPKQPLGRQSGMTLIELMVTVSILVVLMLVAVPSFVEFRRNSELSDAISNFSAGANLAKSTAMKRGTNTYMQPQVLASGWPSGWIVFVDINWNQAYDPGVDELVMTGEPVPSDISVGTLSGTFSDGYLMFNGSGYPRLKSGAFGSGTMILRHPNRSISIIVNSAGRIRSCKTGTTDC